MTKKHYEALGFVEALIAIMVVGISSVVLMQIAVNTMQNTIQNETIDKMTQYAVEGAELAQEIADREISTGDDLFPDEGLWDSCFSFDQEGEEINFAEESEGNFVVYEELNRDGYKDDAVLSDEDEFFRIVCLDSGTVDPTFVVGRVIVGQRISDGEISVGTDVKDYTYMTVIKL